MVHYRRVANLKTVTDLREYVDSLGIELPVDDVVQIGPGAPLAQPLNRDGLLIGNRFAMLPMEGWDATADGCPSDLVRRRWRNFGRSGAKLIWGGEAVAVRPDGRANPNQLAIHTKNVHEFASLRELLVSSHQEQFGRADDLLIGLQLTHSGRFAKPADHFKLEPKILYHHPLLDARYKVPPDLPVLADDEIDRLIDDFVEAAALAHTAGFDFVDIKHCHGYLGHEFLSAVDRPGKFGGSFENRTRFLRDIVAGIRARVPGLRIAVRLSAIDWIPFHPGADGQGQPVQFAGAYPYAFGGDGTGLGVALSEPIAFLELLRSLDIKLVCITVGSPYYTPHIQRPALFPPSDGYLPPEDPLVGVARHIAITRELKQRFPDLVFVGSGYSYLQEWLGNVAQGAVRRGDVDVVGLGRMAVTYPEIVEAILGGLGLQRKRLCRSFSDCTTAPRNGLVSGCYPLDEFYKQRPEARTLARIKQDAKAEA